jgi:hypothetical protein
VGAPSRRIVPTSLGEVCSWWGMGKHAVNVAAQQAKLKATARQVMRE